MAVAASLLMLIIAAAIGRKLIIKAMRESEARLVERLRAVEAGMQGQFQQLGGQVHQQVKRAGKDAEAARRAEENLLEVAKGLTDASIRFDERLKAIERKTT
jgi:hypothetical protein